MHYRINRDSIMARHYLMRKVLVRKKNATTNTWASLADAIELKQVRNFSVREGIGKTKDTFNVVLNNAHANLEFTKYSGDGSTKTFQLPYYPVPTDYFGTELFRVKVDEEVYVYTSGTPSSNAANNEYTVSGSTVTFGASPVTGTENITIPFKILETEDLVRIYRWTDSASESNTDILSEGLINGTMDQLNDKGRVKTVKGVSLIEVMFKVLAFYRQTSNTVKTASSIAKEIMEYVNELNSQGNADNIYKTLNWASTNDAVGTVSTKEITYNTPYKRSIEIIEDLSADEYTGNGQYIAYVLYNASTDKYDFHFVPRPTTNSGTLAEGVDFASIKTDKNSDQVINSAIYNCGSDCEGNGQEYLYIDYTAKGNSSWKYINETNKLFEDVLNKEFESDTSLWRSQTKTDGAKVRDGFYPTTTAIAVPYSFTFNTRSSVPPYNETSTAATASTETSFNQAISDECRAVGWRKAKAIVDQLNDFRIEVSGEIPIHKVSSAFTSGNLHTLNISSSGVENKNLRIEMLKHNLITTDPDFKEDEREL